MCRVLHFEAGDVLDKCQAVATYLRFEAIKQSASWSDNEDTFVVMPYCWPIPNAFGTCVSREYRYWKRTKAIDGLAFVNEPKADRSLIMVYKRQDLIDASVRMESSYQYAQFAYEMISSKTPRRKKYYNSLYSEPEIWKALQKHRESQGRARKKGQT